MVSASGILFLPWFRGKALGSDTEGPGLIPSPATNIQRKTFWSRSIIGIICLHGFSSWASLILPLISPVLEKCMTEMVSDFECRND